MAVTVKEFFFRAPTTKAIEQAKLEGLPTPIKRAPLKLAVDVLDYNGIIDVIAAATDDNATPAGRSPRCPSGSYGRCSGLLGK